MRAKSGCYNSLSGWMVAHAKKAFMVTMRIRGAGPSAHLECRAEYAA